MNVPLPIMAVNIGVSTPVGRIDANVTQDTGLMLMEGLAMVSVHSITVCTNMAFSPNCSDIDECTLGTDNCEQVCHNTVGSFFCTCRPGSTLDNNGYTCHGGYILM